MCLLCTEVIKESLSPKEYWSNYREMNIPEEHIPELLSKVLETSLEYQEALTKAALEE